MSYHNRGSNKNTPYIKITLILLIVIAIFLMWNSRQEEAKSARLIQLQKEQKEERQAQKNTLKERESTASFYQKLADGFDVNILLVGDSIGEGAGTQTAGKQWYIQLQNYLRSNYKTGVNLTNISMGGNSSYAGYVRTRALDDGVNYDLAIICYGHNDVVDGFSTYYESIIRSINSKYPDCSIISILESSQREYTEKMKTIQSICTHYGIPLADTIEPFSSKYDSLTKDGVHPNDEGQDIYFNTVKKIIDENVTASTGKMKEASVINEDVKKYDKFSWYGVGDSNVEGNKGFERINDTTFMLNTTDSGIFGIDYTYESGENKADIYVDDILYKSPIVTFDYDFSQRHILIVSENCAVEREIKVNFSSKEQADGFKGICFSRE